LYVLDDSVLCIELMHIYYDNKLVGYFRGNKTKALL
jgi:hypothetical protein